MENGFCQLFSSQNVNFSSFLGNILTSGLRIFFTPDWSGMLRPKVWVYAAAQVFNSVGIAFGSLIAFASYQDFHGPILRNSLIVIVIDAITCILCGVCVFATLGSLAFSQGTSVDKVRECA